MSVRVGNIFGGLKIGDVSRCQKCIKNLKKRVKAFAYVVEGLVKLYSLPVVCHLLHTGTKQLFGRAWFRANYKLVGRLLGNG